ncbi:MAG: hypothetical protein M1368_02960 [Thaumarchaeota archaeon]|nr:hypothetical protein [Nitrososphaerota archaeon]
MRTGTIAGIVVLIIGLIGMGAGAAYSSLGGEVAGAVVTAIGVITGGVGAGLRRGAP